MAAGTITFNGNPAAVFNNQVTFNDEITANGKATFNNVVNTKQQVIFDNIITANGKATFKNTATFNNLAIFNSSAKLAYTYKYDAIQYTNLNIPYINTLYDVCVIPTFSENSPLSAINKIHTSKTWAEAEKNLSALPMYYRVRWRRAYKRTTSITNAFYNITNANVSRNMKSRIYVFPCPSNELPDGYYALPAFDRSHLISNVDMEVTTMLDVDFLNIINQYTPKIIDQDVSDMTALQNISSFIINYRSYLNYMFTPQVPKDTDLYKSLTGTNDITNGDIQQLSALVFSVSKQDNKYTYSDHILYGYNKKSGNLGWYDILKNPSATLTPYMPICRRKFTCKMEFSNIIIIFKY